MNATAHWPTAHGPDCASATHAGRSPPRGTHSQRRGLLPKLLWADLLSCFSFYPNMTTLRSVLCYRKSIWLLSSVMFVPYLGVETFGNISSPFCTIAILWPPCKILQRSFQGNPTSEALNARGVAKPSDVPFGYLISWWVSCVVTDDIWWQTRQLETTQAYHGATTNDRPTTRLHWTWIARLHFYSAYRVRGYRGADGY